MGLGSKASEVFATELAKIKSSELRQFTVDAFDLLAPQSFFERAASKGGRYHPGFVQGEGGLVRHVQYGVWWGEEMCEMWMDKHDPSTATHRDVVLSALLLHDTMKDGDPTLAHLPQRQGSNGGKLILGCHGVDMAQAIFQRMLNGQATQEQKLICWGIAGHMGKWTTPTQFCPENIQGQLERRIAQIVHAADYAASRKVDPFFAGAS